MVLIRGRAFVAAVYLRWKTSITTRHLCEAVWWPGPYAGRPTFRHGVTLTHCSAAVCTLVLRAPQRALDESTPENGHTSPTQTEFLLIKKL